MRLSEMSGDNSGGVGNSECVGNPDGEEGEGQQGQHRGGNQQEWGRGRTRVEDVGVEVASR